MKNQPNRRSFLALTGTTSIGAIAGCANLNSQSEPDESDGDDSTENEGDSSGTTATLTAQIQPDQEELTAFQEELQTEIEDGETSQREAQQELQSKRTELIEQAVSSYEETSADDDTISVENSDSESGLLQLDAPATTFVSALQEGDLAGVFPEEYYEQYIQQREQQQELQEQMEQQENDTSGD